MTISTSDNRNDYIGDDVTVIFPYTFRIFDETHIDVFLDGVLQTLTTHYTVSGVGDTGGGNITFLTAPAAGVEVTHLRDVPITQETDYPPNNPFPAEAHENALDKGTMIDQQHDEELGRAIKLPVDSQLVDVPFPNPEDPADQGGVVRVTATGYDTVAFAEDDIVSPLGAKGDLLVHDGAVATAETVGADGLVLTADSGNANGVVWQTPTPTAGRVDGRVLMSDSSATDGVAWADAGEREAFKGLHLRTDPDNNAAATRVLLVSADEIIMDDGTLVTDWRGANANVALSGAGGLDTGVEQADTWYEIYAIGKKSAGLGSRAFIGGGGASDLLLHRAKDFFLDEDQPSTNTGHTLRDAAARTKLAQGFQVDTAGAFPFVDVLIKKIGAPTGNVTLQLAADAAGDPGTVVAVSDTMEITNLSTTATWVRFIFRTPPTLAALTQYHLVMTGDYAISGANHIRWEADSAQPYPRGTLKGFDGASWAGIGADTTFKIYVTRNDAAVTMPAGWDQKCHIGYVYNGAGSDFKRFIAQNRFVKFAGPNADTKVGDNTQTTPTKQDIPEFVPPAKSVKIYISVGIDAVSPVYLGPAPDGYVFSPTPGSRFIQGGHVTFSGAATGKDDPFLPVAPFVTETQATYSCVDSGAVTGFVQAFEWEGR